MQVYTWIVENWRMLLPVGLLLFLLSISGSITRMLRDAKNGLKETMTPLGFIIFLMILYLAFKIYLSVAETLWEIL